MGYRLRRSGHLALLVVVMAGVCAWMFEVYRGFRSALPPGAQSACDVVEAVLACGGAVWGWVTGRRDVRLQITLARSGRVASPFSRRTAFLLRAGRALLLIAAPAVPAVMVAAAALCIAITAVRETPAEIRARRELAARGLPPYPAGTTGMAAAEEA